MGQAMDEIMPRRVQKSRQSQSPQILTDKPLTPWEKAKVTVAEALEVKAMNQALGNDRPPTPIQETPASLVTETMKVSREMLAGEREARRAAEDTKDEVIKDFFKGEANRIKEEREKLQGISQASPVSESLAIFDHVISFWEKLKKELASGDGTKPLVTTPTTDGATLIALKKLEIDSLANHDQVTLQIQQMEDDRLQRKMDYETDRDRERRKQEQDDRRWWAEFDLKKDGIGRSKDLQTKATNTISDLATGLLGSIERDMEEGVPVAANRSRERVESPSNRDAGGTIFRPKVFRCSGVNSNNTPCHAMLTVPEGVDVVTCPSCGAIYDIVPLSEANTNTSSNREVSRGSEATQGQPPEVRQAGVDNFPGQAMESAEFVASAGQDWRAESPVAD